MLGDATVKRHHLTAREFDLPTAGAAMLTVALWDGEALEVAVRVAGPDPRVLVVGGTHGDDFEGQIAALDLARALPDLALHGTLIVLPLHNPTAARAGTRETPTDGRDLNRACGLADSTGPTARIARLVTDHLLTRVDLVIELHSGGRQSDFVLSSNLQARPGGDEHADMRPRALCRG